MKPTFVFILGAALMLLTTPAGAQVSGENLLAGVEGFFLDPLGIGQYKLCGLDDEALRVAQTQPFQAQPFRKAGLSTGSSFHTIYSMAVDVLMVWPASGGEPICSAAITFRVMGYEQRDTELAEGAPGLGPYRLILGSTRHVLHPLGEFAEAVLAAIRDETIWIASKWVAWQ